MHQLDELSLDVLKLSNGQRHRDEMADALGDRLQAGRTTLDAVLANLTRRAPFVA